MLGSKCRVVRGTGFEGGAKFGGGFQVIPGHHGFLQTALRRISRFDFQEIIRGMARECLGLVASLNGSRLDTRRFDCFLDPNNNSQRLWVFSIVFFSIKLSIRSEAKPSLETGFR